MNLDDVMDQIGTQLDTIDELRVYPYPADQIAAPAAAVTYPESIDFDGGYGRGMDRIPDLPVIVLVAKPWDRSTRDQITAYCNGSGASSVKAVIEAGTYTAFDTVRVTSVDIDAVSVAGVEYLAAAFHLDIVGPGGS